MAFLKDHRVENMIIFPAAAFVEMALEAGVQMFESKPFVVEDFEIRKPLILPDPPSGLLLELTYDTNERTFAIQSRFESGASWSVHVVGSMRGERTESSFAATHWDKARPTGLDVVGLDTFYGHMSDLGLRYGEEFRPIRELAASGGKSSGRVSLSDSISSRAAEYPLHPVLFDGALQTFSAGAATVENRTTGLRLPVRFARILFLRSPGASCLVKAGVQQANEEFVEGGIDLYDETGRPHRRLPRDQRGGRSPLRQDRQGPRPRLSRGLGENRNSIKTQHANAAAARPPARGGPVRARRGAGHARPRQSRGRQRGG
jgi:acyl transferase domain-containing protein